MARRGPPFDFDLNEPPPEDNGASDASPDRAPEPAGGDLLPALMHDPVPAPHHDSLALLPPPPPAPETQPSPHDSSPAPVPASSPHDSLPEPVAESSPQDSLPAPVAESSPQDPPAPPAPVPASSLHEHDPLPAPTPEPSPRDPPHLPSSVLDLEAPLSSLDEDDEDDGDYYDCDEADLPPPPPLPPFGLHIAAAPARSPSSADTRRALPPPPNLDGERTSRARAPSQERIGDAARLSSPDNSARRGTSRAGSGTTSSPRSRRRPYSYEPRDDAISKQRRVDYYEEDAGSCRSGSRRSEHGFPPRRYERSELASPPRYEQDDERRAPAAHGQRNRRRRRRPQNGYQYQGPVQKQPQGRGREQHHHQQGFQRQERRTAHQGYNGPHGPDAAKVGYSSYYPLSGPSSDGRQSPEREPISGNGGYHQRREAPPFRPSSRQHGREDSYHGRQQSHSQGAPKIGGYHQPSPRPSSGAHGREDSSGGRQGPAQQPINGGAYQQRKAPRGRDHFSDRPYHPYARDGGAFDRNGGRDHARREPRPSYEHRGDSKQQGTSGGPARGRQYY